MQAITLFENGTDRILRAKDSTTLQVAIKGNGVKYCRKCEYSTGPCNY